MTAKKVPKISEQLKAGGVSLDEWANGKTRLRTTLVSKDGERHTVRLTRSELQAKLNNAKSLKAIRADLDLSQPKFAELLQASPAAVKQWETARRAIPASILALAELAREMPAVRKRLERGFAF